MSLHLEENLILRNINISKKGRCHCLYDTTYNKTRRSH